VTDCQDDQDHAGCDVCRAEFRALDELEPIEPGFRTGLALRSRVAYDRVRETVASAETWGVAALTACVAVVISILLETAALPYSALAEACQTLVGDLLPTSAAYLLAGVLASLVPVCLATYLQARRSVPGVVAWLETPVVSAALLSVYAIVSCGDYPGAFLAGFLSGIVIGAFAGAAAGHWLGRRVAWR
jgi:hypothetical protein